MVLSTVAAVAVVPLTIDLYTPERSFDPSAGTSEVSAPTAVEVPPTQRADGMADRAGAAVVDPGVVAAATLASEPDDVPAVVERFSDPIAAEPITDPGAGVLTPSATGPSLVPVRPIDAVRPTVPMRSIDTVDDVDGESQIEEQSEGRLSGAVAAAGPTPIDDGVSSGTGGDLPPESLPTSAPPQRPTNASGPGWTDPADPSTGIGPVSIPFHEPTPPGIPPELLEPLVEAPEAPEAPEGFEGSVGWYEPTPPGIDPSLLEPVMEDDGPSGPEN